MNPNALLEAFRNKVSAEVELEPEGIDRFVVYTPFMFDDGDHYVVVLRRYQNKWLFTDEGHTLMHLNYSGVDLSASTRARVIEESLTAHGVENENGELRLNVPDEDFGNALFSFVQALTRTATVAQFTRERVSSAFLDEVNAMLAEIVPANRIQTEWHEPTLDPDRHYVVDYKINGMPRPCFVFAIQSTDKCRNAAITCLTFEKWRREFSGIALFEDQASITRQAVAQLSDVIGKQFSSIGDRERIAEYFRREVLLSGPSIP